ncbi:MAG: D-alanyl-D-alanine carboxypeptidase/D-alanyl-D-alanine-endopeptidase [Actinomycetota bacterium]
MRRSLVCFWLLALILSTLAPAASARPGWKRDLDRIARGRNIGIHVRDEGQPLYGWGAGRRRVPASNEKVLLSMAVLDRFDPTTRLRTSALGRRVTDGVLEGHLYVVGRGDPSLTSGGSFGPSLPFKPARLSSLARKIKEAGVTRIEGRVVGVRSYFSHDWWAPGWKSSFPVMYVALPAALNLNGNLHKGRRIDNPEWRVAATLSKRLKSLGVRVGGRPKTKGMPPPSARGLIAKVDSPSLNTLLRYTNRRSSNFFAEVLGKQLAVGRSGPPSTIHKAAKAIEAWSARHGARVTARDSSGLSYANRVSPKAFTRLLAAAEEQPWGERLRLMLPAGGEGTLEDRLRGAHVRAKTGTLDGISTLSGWVRLSQTKSWAEFSLMSRGMPKHRAVKLEDKIVRLLRKRARP